LEDRLALDGAEKGLVFGSGMAAITTDADILASRKRRLSVATGIWWHGVLFENILPQFDIRTHWFAAGVADQRWPKRGPLVTQRVAWE